MNGYVKNVLTTPTKNKTLEKKGMVRIYFIHKDIDLFLNFCIFACFILVVEVSFIVFIKNGCFLIPEGQIKRAIVFGCIPGATIKLASIVLTL